MITELVRQGRQFLKAGQLVRAGEVCQKISIYLEFYVINDEDWERVDHFLKEALLMRKLAAWKEMGHPEYDELQKLLVQSSSLAGLDMQKLEKYLN